MRRQCNLIGSSILGVLSLLCGGCSPRDPVDTTPVYHVGTPTNRSSVNSWELNNEPFHTQPGVNGGKPVILPNVPSQRGYEPNDPLAESVYSALMADGTIGTRYVSPRAKEGTVILVGTVQTAQQKARALAVAQNVPGVKTVHNELTVVSPDGK